MLVELFTSKRIQLVQFALAISAYLLSLIKYLQLNKLTLYNSDLLYIPALFKDITEWGGSLLEWRLTPSPFFFPDMALYFSLATVISNWHIAALLYAVTQITLFTLGWCLVGRYLFSNKQHQLGYASFVLLTTAALLSINPITQYIIKPQFSISIHFGVMLCLPYLLALALHLLNRQKHIFPIIALVAILALTSLSDSISYIHLSLPLLAAVLFLWSLKIISRQTVLFFIALLTAGFLLAQLLALWIIRYPSMHAIWQVVPISQRIGDSLREIISTAISLWESNNGFVLVLLVITMTLHLIICLFAIKNSANKRHFNSSFLFISMFTIVSILLAIIGAVGTGLFLGIAEMRYLYPVTVLPIYSLLPAVYFVFQRFKYTNHVLLLITVFIVLANANALTQFDHLDKYHDHYPALVKCIDDATSQRGVTSGVGGYWDAKYVSTLSKQGVMISQVQANFDPYIWINNPHWYQRFPPQFILFDPGATNKLDMAMIINLYGYPEEIVNCETRELWFYDRSYDQPFQAYYQDHPGTVNWCEPMAHAEIPAYLWRGEVGKVHTSSVIAENLSGSISSGMLLFHPPGQYEISLLYQYTGTSKEADIGEIAIGSIPINATVPEEWRREPIPPDKGIVTINFELSEYTHVLIDVSFDGEGMIRLDQFDLQKTSNTRCK